MSKRSMSITKIDSLIASASKLAANLSHKYVTVEHLLLASLDNAAEKEQLRFWSVDASALRSSLEAFLRGNVPTLTPSESGHEPQPTVGFGRVVKRVVDTGTGKANASNLLDAILYEHVHDSIAVKLLQQHGLAIALPQVTQMLDNKTSRAAIVDAHGDSAKSDLEAVLARVGGCNVPVLRNALNLIADWAKFTHLVEDDSVRKEKMLQMCNVFECLRVNSIEDRLDEFIAMLARVDDEDRQTLSQNLATLVLAPDSKKVKEECLKGLAGHKAMGYKPQQDRDAAREVRNSLDGNSAFEAFRKARNKETA